MKSVVRLAVSAFMAGGALLSAQQSGVPLPSEPPRQFGSSVTPSFDGWYNGPGGTRFFLIGYLNRNLKQAVDVPIGPNNRIEPGGPDMGQPTHFLPGRQYGVFSIEVPKDFTREQRYTWTLVVNGQTMSVPFRLHIDYNVSPLGLPTDPNTPPVLRLFDEKGPTMQGPFATVAKATSHTTSVGVPLQLPIWVSDDAHYSSGSNAPLRNPPPPVEYEWVKFRGPGTVTFTSNKPPLETLKGGKVGEPYAGRGTTTAKFSAPGEYMLELVVNDYSGPGGGGEVCCWTNAIIKVTVTP
jgi:hypothetical protein